MTSLRLAATEAAGAVMAGARRAALLALLAFVAGCRGGGPTWIEIDPAWSPGVPLPVPLTGVAAAAFDGAIYVAGGESEAGPSQAVYRWSADGRDWERLADLPVQRLNGQLVVSNGALYLAGGWEIRPGNALFPARDVWRYLPATDEWVERAPLPDLRQGSAIGMPGGIVVVGGGFGSAEHGGTFPGDSVAVYTASMNTWRYGAPIRTPRHAPMAVAVGSRVHVFGGVAVTAGTALEIEIYDAATDAWMPGGDLYGDYALVLGQAYARSADHVHFFGGLVAVPGGSILAVHMRYDLATNRWERMPFMPTPRSNAAAVALDGRIHVIGGSIDRRGAPGWITRSVEVFSSGF
jgi:hypothetical protein